MQLVVGIHGHRHVHTGAAVAVPAPESALASLAKPLRAVLDHLHAAQDPRLQAQASRWVPSRGDSAGRHEHGGVFHEHSQVDADVLELGDTSDEPAQGGATAFLAWLPAALALPAGEASDHPVTADLDWRDRVVAPPLTPPRG